MTDNQQERVATVVTAVMDRIREVIVEHKVTYDEYAAAKQYAIALGEAGEWPLFGDVFFESTVERVDSEGREGSAGAIEGPYYIPDSPLLERPYVMPMRDDEPGDVLIFSGTVCGADGTPLADAQIEMWHSDNDGTYSGIPYPDDRQLPPPFNLRGRFTTDENGRFEVRTIIPVPYEIPKGGPTGALLRAAGWHAFRPAHLHCITSAPGYASLTSQLYFDEDPYIDSDIASAVKPELTLQLTKHDDAADLAARGLDRPYFSTSYEFRLPRA
ncbi:dioxygenase family protein [Planosporangium mesophilum]|uniref:Catechol 1,2-dioxygenase n=1 Tax=Planosporangium mesophilum TaxID=689768 RepID=A0A8J3TL15_9ACTN|nr:dioxygenase [Planosporangium mesophilum]NJC86281.1 catechol 1,2-dioxygenase [Planosporangium mesophilum]GII23310.1 catechol 1,2-dioxygenase [Planosporangium mesophilum]